MYKAIIVLHSSAVWSGTNYINFFMLIPHFCSFLSTESNCHWKKILKKKKNLARKNIFYICIFGHSHLLLSETKLHEQRGKTWEISTSKQGRDEDNHTCFSSKLNLLPVIIKTCFCHCLFFFFSSLELQPKLEASHVTGRSFFFLILTVISMTCHIFLQSLILMTQNKILIGHTFIPMKSPVILHMFKTLSSGIFFYLQRFLRVQ